MVSLSRLTSRSQFADKLATERELEESHPLRHE
jgi:hypothetical protein